MKKIAPAIAGVLLGLVFVAFSVIFLFHLITPPPFPAGSPTETFMNAMIPTGYMTMVKVFELIGGVLVMIPLTRNVGLLILGPIIVNILTFTILINGGIAGLANPVAGAIIVLPLYLLWVERKAFAALVRRPV